MQSIIEKTGDASPLIDKSIIKAIVYCDKIILVLNDCEGTFSFLSIKINASYEGEETFKVCDSLSPYEQCCLGLITREEQLKLQAIETKAIEDRKVADDYRLYCQLKERFAPIDAAIDDAKKGVRVNGRDTETDAQ